MNLFRLCMGICVLASSVAFAGDSSPPTPRDLELEKAKTAIARKDWPAALAVLETYTVANPRTPTASI